MENAALLKALVRNAIDGILTIDERGIIESINPSACKLFGYPEQEVIGKNISMLMPSPHKARHDTYLSNYKNTRKPGIIGVGRELMGLRKNGDVFPLHLGVSEVNYSGRTIYCGFIHDLSNQKESEERLKQYASHLEELVEDRTQSLNNTIADLQLAKEKISQSLLKEKELNKLKSQFLSMASHEFRTPLSTVQLSVSLINKYAEDYKNANINKHIGKIKNAVTSLTAILNDFLYAENLELKKLKASFADFNLVELGKEITEEMQLLVKEGQKIQYHHQGNSNMVKLDKNLIKNSIINLIINAIKYSAENTVIEFTTTIDEKQCVISIKNQGIGIPEEDQKYLFDAFFRAHNTGNIPGTGLGLTIVSRYVNLMKGTIDFESTPQKGTLFTLLFPIE
ncbi:MAG: PAS domain-containing sensor histidine kinase [Flavobacterium sp.]